MSENVEVIAETAEPVQVDLPEAAAIEDKATLPEGGSDAGKVVAPDWPEDWRAKIAGDDEKELKRLQRFSSPAEIAKSYRELEQKFSKVGHKAALPEDATDEQRAAWRKANGVPDKPDGYLDAMPKGLVVGDEDRPILDAFLERAHAQNAPPGMVGEFVDWYYGEQEARVAALADEDKSYREKAEDTLRAEWGDEYRDNIRAFRNFLEGAPEVVRKNFLTGRLADNSVIGNNPDVLRWMVSLARDLNPAGTVVPGSGMSQIDGVESEISKIQETMRTDRSAYNKDEKMQARYRQLLEAQDRLNSQGRSR